MVIGLAVFLAESDVDQAVAVGNDGAIGAQVIGHAFRLAAGLYAYKNSAEYSIILFISFKYIGLLNSSISNQDDYATPYFNHSH